MARYRVKTELFISAITELVKIGEPLGISRVITDDLAKGLSTTGAVIGSPFGLLPVLNDYYSSGIGATARLQASRIFQTYRFTPAMVVDLWRRGYPDETYKEEWWQELIDQGWSKEQIAAAKELAKVLPTPQDVVAFLAHEVYEPEMIKKYGLDDEWDKVDKSKFAPIGLTEDLARDYWRNHWQHASFTQLVEMRRRELINDQDVYDWFRLVEIPPFWRKMLTELVWEIPTRVDIRRFLDMGTIKESRLRDYYGRLGYHNKDLEDYVLWTKVYNAVPDLIARYKNGWIPEQEVKDTLVKLGMDETAARELFETKIKAPTQLERIVPERDLTAAEIYKGVKQGLISWDEGKEYLMFLGWDDWEAEYKLEINVKATSSPETPLEFKQMVNSFQKAIGKPVKEIPQELLEAEKAMFEAKKRLEQARQQSQPQEVVNQLEADYYQAEAHYKISISLHGKP